MFSPAQDYSTFYFSDSYTSQYIVMNMENSGQILESLVTLILVQALGRALILTFQ